MTLTVYVKPACVQCTSTFRALDARGIEYEIISLVEDSAALEVVTALGYEQAPVVMTPYGDHWSGFRPDEIDGYMEDMALESEMREAFFEEQKRRRQARLSRLVKS